MGGRQKSLKLWGSASTCLKIICLAWIAQVAALNASAFSLVFDSLPVCILPVVRSFSVLPTEEVVPHMFWKLLFYPLEVMTLLPAMYLIVLNACTLVVAFRVLQVSAELLRYIFIPS